ncbi:MAG: UDP-N-acetylglucosamine 2-epimerase [Bacillota bacterium]
MAQNTTTLLKSCGGKIKVLALTGIRSEYDLLFPLLNVLNQDDDFELGIIVCGAHLTSLHDYSVRQIEQDGFLIVEKIENLLYSSSSVGKVKSAANLLQGIAQVLDRVSPDILIVLGDREEAIIGALAGGYMSVPVVHLAGGDNTHPKGGNVDEEVRHATTKLSHIHLTMAEEHTRRIISLGEEQWRTFTVGSGGVDRLRMDQGLSFDELRAVLGSGVSSDYIVLIQHPLSSEQGQEEEQMRLILQACIAVGVNIFVGAPNSDPGFEDIIKVIKEFEKHPQIYVYNNLPRKAFTSLLSHAKCLAGNSSLGLHEAPYLGLPAVNIGERQKERIASNNMQFVPVDYDAIMAAVNKAVKDKDYRNGVDRGKTAYGDGFMAEKTLTILKELPGKKRLLAKKITY